MSFGNKDNGREYINRTNTNPNKMQSINNRNVNSSQQYSNSNNGENYSYDMKRGCNSPKQCGEIYGNQQNSNIKEHYPYKNDNSRARHFPSKYNNDRPNYYSQQSNSPTDIVIPDIDQLKEFIKEQSEHFKSELAKYEGRKSCSPTPRGNFHQDQNPQRSQQRPYTGQNRSVSGMSTSNSLGTIACSSSNNNKQQSNSYPAKCNCSKSTVQSTGKSNFDTNFSKAPPMNKNRVGSPNNIVEKPTGNKSQFMGSSSNVGGPRQDTKSDMNRSSNKFPPYSFSSGSNFHANQQNSNNQMTALSYAKMNQQSRSNANAAPPPPPPPSQPQPQAAATVAVVANGKVTNASSNSFDTHKSTGSRQNGEPQQEHHHQVRPQRVEVHVADIARSISHSGNTTDSLDVEFCASDSPTSPCSLRSSQTDDNRPVAIAGQSRCAKKAM